MAPIKTLAELTGIDQRSLLFGPLGFGQNADAEAVSKYHQELINSIELSELVPETTRSSFERLLMIYTYGILSYDLYTIAGDMSRLVVEQALRERFLPFYSGTVTFIDIDNNDHILQPDNFDKLFKEIHKDSRLAPEKAWRLRLRNGDTIRFDCMLDSLFQWARAEGLLGGQGDRIRDRARISLRNFVAHPSYHLNTPVEASTAIADLANLINRLWGVSDRSVRREVLIIAWSDDTITWNSASSFQPDHMPATSKYAIILADPDDPEIARFDPKFEATIHPSDYLWGPGSWSDAAQWLQEEQPEEDDVSVHDRLFLLRYENKRLYLPQNPNVAAGVDSGERSGTWYLLRADSPFTAFDHQRRVLSNAGEHSKRGRCQCPVETIGSGTWHEVLDLCTEIGITVTPQSVPDFRITGPFMPRWNLILGKGQWQPEAM